jgi:hypothetical protein
MTLSLIGGILPVSNTYLPEGGFEGGRGKAKSRKMKSERGPARLSAFIFQLSLPPWLSFLKRGDCDEVGY